MRDDVLPCAAVRDLVDRRSDDAEIARLPVGAEHEAVAGVLQLVLVVAFARHCDLEGERRIGGVGIAPFGGYRALHRDEQEAVGLRATDPHVEAVVLLFVDESVLRWIGAAAVPFALMRAPRATTRAVASEGFALARPLMTVPGSIVSKAPASTKILASRMYTLDRVQVVFVVMAEVTTTSAANRPAGATRSARSELRRTERFMRMLLLGLAERKMVRRARLRSRSRG